MASFAILFGCYYVYSCVAATKGKFTIGMVMHGVWCRYGFLIKQLVSRDFKTKYKRSVLGYVEFFKSVDDYDGTVYCVLSVVSVQY